METNLNARLQLIVREERGGVFADKMIGEIYFFFLFHFTGRLSYDILKVKKKEEERKEKKPMHG